MLKNLNVYWTVSAALALWLFFVHAPPILIKLDAIMHPILIVHLICVFMIYMGCLFNTLFTPSTMNGRARPYHIIVGRFSMAAGFVGVISGAWKSWVPFGAVPLSFSIPITVGGVAQIAAQYIGFIAIKKFQRLRKEVEEIEVSSSSKDVPMSLRQQKDTALRTHIYSMVLVLTAACGNPAAIRVGALFGPSALFATLVFVVALWTMAAPFARIYSVRLVAGEERVLDEMTSLVA